jgi:uncharacterized protein YebE (UPF0316 family)
MSLFFLETPFFSLLVLPLLIFTSRVIDVTLGTLRIAFISQGRRGLAPLVGFFEVFIWLIAMGQVFNNLTNIFYYVAYAGGFAMGNYIGLFLEDKISLRLINMQLIVRENVISLINILKENNYELTTMTAEDTKGFVKIVNVVLMRRNLPKILTLVRSNNPNAYISIEDVKSFSIGNIPHLRRWYKRKKIK